MSRPTKELRRPSGWLLPRLRDVLRGRSPELAARTFTTMNQVVDDSFGNQRIAARLLEVFAGSALLLCVIGLYGSLAYLVSQRTQELAIRLALGAPRQQVIWLVLHEAEWILLAGSAVGLALEWSPESRQPIKTLVTIR